ncbi:MAG: hypothetical protein WBC63_01845 [Candidatus Bipolaricaulia bacterium]
MAATCESRSVLLELRGADLSGDAPGARLLDERVASLLDALRAPALTAMKIQRIDVTDPSSITLDAETGLRVLLGAIELHVRRVEALVALSRAIDLGSYSLIDLRLEGEARLVTW